MTDVQKIPAVKIELERAEGRHNECIKLAFEGDVWNRASATLFAWSMTAPKNGGYHKCDFKITYADGETYEGRYDLMHHTRERPSLPRHMTAHLEAMSLRRIPAHYDTPEDRPRFEAFAREHGNPEAAAKFLDTYEIGA